MPPRAEALAWLRRRGRRRRPRRRSPRAGGAPLLARDLAAARGSRAAPPPARPSSRSPAGADALAFAAAIDRARARAHRLLDADLGPRPGARARWRATLRHHGDIAPAAAGARARAARPGGALRPRPRARRGAAPRRASAQPAAAGRAPADGLQSGHLRSDAHERQRVRDRRRIAARGLHPGDPLQGRALRGLDPAAARAAASSCPATASTRAGRGSARPALAARRSQQDPAAGHASPGSTRRTRTGNRPQGIGVQLQDSEAARELSKKVEGLLAGALQSSRPTHTI